MKKVLLDTHVFLWWIDQEKHDLIGPSAKKIVSDSRNDIYVSAASVWEIAINKGIGIHRDA